MTDENALSKRYYCGTLMLTTGKRYKDPLAKPTLESKPSDKQTRQPPNRPDLIEQDFEPSDIDADD